MNKTQQVSTKSPVGEFGEGPSEGQPVAKPDGYGVWHTKIGRFGTITIKPQRYRLGADGVTGAYSKSVRLRLMPAWLPSKTDSSAGPEFIDLDNPGADNEISMSAFWGEDWKDELVKWMMAPTQQRMFAFEKGDPRPLRKVKVEMTQGEYEELQKSGALKGQSAVTMGNVPRQTVIRGPRTTSDRAHS